MKTSISTFVTVLLIVVSLTSFANANSWKKDDSSDIFSTYLSAVTKGNINTKHLNLAKDFEYHNIASNTIANKKVYSKFLKQTENLQYNCKTSTHITEETTNTRIAKVSIQFECFKRVDYITLCLQNNDWKISKVVTTYP